MVSKDNQVARPTKKNEYTIVFGSKSDQKGWDDLKAVSRSKLTDAWDYLTKSPEVKNQLCYPLKGRLATVERDGKSFVRWQKKLSPTDGARIWYYVDNDKKQVVLEEVHTSHPNETK